MLCTISAINQVGYISDIGHVTPPSYRSDDFASIETQYALSFFLFQMMQDKKIFYIINRNN